MGEKLPYDGLGALTALLLGYFNSATDEEGMEIELTVEPDEIENGDFFDADDEDDEDEDFDKSDIEAELNATRIIPDIESVIFSGPATTIILADGEKTTVKCSKDQQFDRYAGFAAAVCKRLFGSTAKAQACMEEKDAERQADLRAAEKAKRAEEEKKELCRNQTESDIPTFEEFSRMINKRLIERTVEEAVEAILSKQKEEDRRLQDVTSSILAAMRKGEEKKDV